MADPHIPRAEDYLDAQGRLKPSQPRKPRTMRERARRLIRDIPVAADSLNAFPGGAVAAAPLKLAGRGLARATAGAAKVAHPSPNPVLRGPNVVIPDVGRATARDQLGGYAASMGVLNLGARIGATQQGRNVRFEEREKKGLTR